MKKSAKNTKMLLKKSIKQQEQKKVRDGKSLKQNKILKHQQSHSMQNKFQNNLMGKKQTHLKFKNTVQTNKKQKQPHLQQMPTIQVLLGISKEERNIKIKQLFRQIETFLHTFMQKKQGSRVVQLMYKWGDISIKKIISQKIHKYWKDLIKSKYALYCIAKVSSDFTLSEINESATVLQMNRQGAQILENYLQKHAQTQQGHKIMQKFIKLHEKALDNDIMAQQLLDNLALRCIQKGYYCFIVSKLILSLRLEHLFEAQQQKTIQFLVTHVAELVADEHGIRLFIVLINLCSPRHKKDIIKVYKGNLKEIFHSNNLAYVSVIKLLTEIDDTVLCGKTLLTEVVQMIPQIINNKKQFAIVFSLISSRQHNYNTLGNYEPIIKMTKCKKTEEVRKKELRSWVYEPLVNFITSDHNIMNQMCRSSTHSKLIVGLVKSMFEGIPSTNLDEYKKIFEFIRAMMNWFLKCAKQTLSGHELQFKQSVLADSNGNKVVKFLLCLQEQMMDYYCDEIGQILVDNFGKVSQTKASYIVLGLLEKGGRDYLLDHILQSKVPIQQIVGSQHYSKLIK